ncbi:MAG: hypothetical protein HZB53_12540 [Chloroflexi bacterium]|nr:hypothetical protein [Chloroflexota bacterium]
MIRQISEKWAPFLLAMARGVGWVLTGASLLLIVLQSSRDFSSFPWATYLVAVASSTVLYGMSFGLQVSVWSLLARGILHRRTDWTDVAIYGTSNVLRRAPGAVWYLLERVKHYEKHEINAAQTLTASGAEWVLLVGASVTVYAFVTSGPLTVASFFACELAVVVGCIWLNRVVESGIYHTGVQLIMRCAAPQYAKLQAFVRLLPHLLLALTIYQFCVFLGAVKVYLLIKAGNPEIAVSLSDATQLWSLTVLFSSLTSPILPVNLGVRDISITALTMKFLPLDSAIFLAATVRVLFVSCDIVYSFIIIALAKVFGARPEVIESSAIGLTQIEIDRQHSKFDDMNIENR